MGKSIRSKTKRAYRHKKREDSDFAVTAAARLARLSAKLANAAGVRGEADAEEPAADEAPVDGEGAETTVTEQDPDAAMDVDASTKATVSTHGPRNSRREQWRASKGWEPRPTAKGMNKQGGIAAKRRPGRAKRRR